MLTRVPSDAWENPDSHWSSLKRLNWVTGFPSEPACAHSSLFSYGSPQNSWALWGLTTATTITGRVLVDAHWLSDTLGGAGLGLAMVSGLAMATDRIAKGSSGAGGGSDGSSSAR